MSLKSFKHYGLRTFREFIIYRKVSTLNLPNGLNRKSVFCRMYKVKVKCTLLQAVRPIGGGGRGIALLFLDHGTRRGWGISVTLRPLFTPGKDPVPIVQEAEWIPGPIWTSAENLAPTGIRFPDRPARSQSLYRLRYPAHCRMYSLVKSTTASEEIAASIFSRNIGISHTNYTTLF